MLRLPFSKSLCFSHWVALLIILGLTGGSAVGQTPSTTIKNSDGKTRFQLNQDGGLYLTGRFLPTSPADSIPATGEGIRTMWHPAKAAFRSGRVFDNTVKENGIDGSAFWDPQNVGRYSVVFGVNSKASAWSSFAAGYRAMATGTNTTAFGIKTKAATKGSFTIGKANDKNRGNDDSDPSTGPVFVVGNGTDNSSRSDALVLQQNGNLEISGTLTESSDRRLKTQVEGLDEGAIEKLLDLRPVRFEFRNQKTHPSGKQIGLIAQDVREEFPALVSGEDDEHLSLAYPRFSAVLLKGFQEQQEQLDHKQSQIDSLKKRIQVLEKQQRQIESVKKRLATLEAQSGTAAAGWTGSLPLRGFGILLIGGVLGASLLHIRRQ